MALNIVPPFKLANSTDIIPRSTGITHIYGNTGGFSLSVGGTAASTAQLDTICSSSTTIGQIIKGAASQSADFLEIQNSAGDNLFKIGSNSQYPTITYFASNQTITGNIIGFDSQTTITSASPLINYFRGLNTIIYTNSPGFAVAPSFFVFQSTIKATTNNLTMSQPTGFSYIPTMTADAIIWTSLESSGSAAFVDSPAYSVANSGSFTMYVHNGFKSSCAVNSGTIDQRNSISILNATGSGTLTTQVGIKIADLSKGGTNIAIQVQGTNAHSRHVPKMHYGADSAPTTQLQVTGDFCTKQTTITFANPCSVTTTTSNSFIITAASSNFTVNASATGTAGQYMFIQWSADAGGSRTITYGTNFKSTGTQSSGGASKTATSLWLSDGTAWWEIARANNLA